MLVFGHRKQCWQTCQHWRLTLTANPYSGACQQRCVYAEALVDAALTEERTLLKTAMLQGAVYQVYSAYIVHLREIAETYNCSDPPSIDNLTALVAAFAGQDVMPPEATELVNLHADKGSWLRQCLDSYEAFQGGQGEPLAISKAGIDLYQENVLQATSDQHLVKTWVDAMSELAVRHRALMHEY